MRNTLTLPRSRVAALVVETNTPSETAVANLLSVLHARKMWAHLDEKKSSRTKAVFVYGANVPTLRHARSLTPARKAAD